MENEAQQIKTFEKQLVDTSAIVNQLLPKLKASWDNIVTGVIKDISSKGPAQYLPVLEEFKNFDYSKDFFMLFQAQDRKTLEDKYLAIAKKINKDPKEVIGPISKITNVLMDEQTGRLFLKSYNIYYYALVVQANLEDALTTAKRDV